MLNVDSDDVIELLRKKSVMDLEEGDPDRDNKKDSSLLKY